MATPRATNYSGLKTSIDSLAKTFDRFVQESGEYRDRNESELKRLWESHEKTAADFRSAIGAVSMRGEITWPKVVTTVLAMLAIGSTFAGVGHRFVTQGFEQALERESIHRYYAEKERDENHAEIASIKTWMAQQEALRGAVAARLDAQDKLTNQIDNGGSRNESRSPE